MDNRRRVKRVVRLVLMFELLFLDIVYYYDDYEVYVSYGDTSKEVPDVVVDITEV